MTIGIGIGIGIYIYGIGSISIGKINALYAYTVVTIVIETFFPVPHLVTMGNAQMEAIVIWKYLK